MIVKNTIFFVLFKCNQGAKQDKVAPAAKQIKNNLILDSYILNDEYLLSPYSASAGSNEPTTFLSWSILAS